MASLMTHEDSDLTVVTGEWFLLLYWLVPEAFTVSSWLLEVSLSVYYTNTRVGILHFLPIPKCIFFSSSLVLGVLSESNVYEGRHGGNMYDVSV